MHFQYSSFLFKNPNFYLIPYAFNMHCRVGLLAINSHVLFLRKSLFFIQVCFLGFFLFFWLGIKFYFSFFSPLKMSFCYLLVCIVLEEKLAIIFNFVILCVMCVSLLSPSPPHPFTNPRLPLQFFLHS